jgi:transposase InsO family protein
MQFSLSKKRTAKEAWDAIAAARIGSDRARKTTLQTLRKEWENLAFKPGEDVDDFALRLNTLQQKMVQFGDNTYGAERAVEKLFRCTPEKYKQIARSIESLLNLSTMSIEEAIGRLNVVCVLTKQSRLPFPQQSSFRAKERLELVHGDLCGPVTPATPEGRRYFLLLIDNLSRYMWVVVLSSKGQAADAIRRAKGAAEAECGRKLCVLRTDNGGEFTAAEFASYCMDEGVQRHYSAPYSPQQNDVVERRNQTVVGMARALLKQRGMSAVFWGEAVVTAVYILNRSPTKALNGRTPYEAWHGLKPAVSHLWVFSMELGHIGKLDDRSTPGVFIGYVEGSKDYRILDPGTQRVRTTRDVVFDEGRGWTWDKAVDDGSTPTYDNFTVEYVHFEGAGGVGSSSTKHVYPSPRAYTDLSATLSSQDLGCNDIFTTTTTVGAPKHSSSDGHPSGHVYSSTSSRRAQPGGVRYPALSRRGAYRRVLRR